MSLRAAAHRLAIDTPVAADERVLPDRGEIASIAVERTRMPMVVFDPRRPGRPIVFANRAFLGLTGYEAEEVLGHGGEMFRGAETDARAIEAIEAAIAQSEEITVEVVGYRKSGGTFWAQVYYSPVLGDDGQLLYYFSSFLDVSKRRQAEELKAAEHRLLLEVDHRAKNALALVQAIVRLSRTDDADDYAQSIQGRVGALARAHSLLADRNWQDLPLERIVEAEARGFGAGRVELRPASTVSVAAGQVQPLALVLHELLSNAERHGALSRPGGKVRISWRDDEATVLIEFRETGGPSPPAAREPGFGMALIESTVSRQLRGQVRFDWQPEGLRATLRIPAGRERSRQPFRLRH